MLSSCGILMGAPLTWITLNIVQLWWIDYALRNSDRNEDRVKICGDDLVGLWTEKEISRYEKVAILCNSEFSKGKHYKSCTQICVDQNRNFKSSGDPLL